MTKKNIKPVTLTTKQLEIMILVESDSKIRLTQDDKKTALRLVARKMLVRTGMYTFRISAIGTKVLNSSNYVVVR